MKITKQKLKEIIKEELMEVEWGGSPSAAAPGLAEDRQQEIKSFEDVAYAISKIVERLEFLERAQKGSAWGSEE